MKCIAPEVKDADQWMWIWEELSRIKSSMRKTIGSRACRGEAHRSKKQQQGMSVFERFVTKGRSKKKCADGWSEMAEIRSAQFSRKENKFSPRCSTHTISIHCFVKEAEKQRP